MLLGSVLFPTRGALEQYISDVALCLVRHVLIDEQLASGRRRWRRVRPLAECEEISILTVLVPIHDLCDLRWP